MEILARSLHTISITITDITVTISIQRY